MDHSLIGRNEDSAVSLCTCESEYVVILVDCAADAAKAVVAVGQNQRGRLNFSIPLALAVWITVA